MKRTISFVISLIMVLTVFVSVPLIKVDTQAADTSKIFTVESSGLKNGKVTYTVYINPGVSFRVANIYTTFDTTALTLVSGDAATTGEGSGDEDKAIPGIYVNGFMDGYNNRYSVGFATSGYMDYTCGNIKTPFVKFVFKLATTSDIDTSVKIYCDEFSSHPQSDNKIPQGSAVLLKNFAVKCKHVYNGRTIDVPATCTSQGIESHCCVICGLKNGFATPIAPTGHTEIKDPSVKPTCTTTGLTEGSHCAVCGAEIKPAEIIPAAGHTYSGWVVDSKPTASSVGWKHNSCTQCGHVLYSDIPRLKPATPKLTAIANTASGVKVSWGKVEGADSYIIYRRTYNAKTKAWGGWARLASGVMSASYADKNVKSGTYYRYTVRATNEGGISGYNTSGLKTYFLSIPKATTANSNSGVTVKWGKVTGATGYIVYRKTGNGKWQNLGKITGTSFTYKTAKAGVTYRYTIKAYYGSYVSAYNTNGYAVRRLLTPTLKSVTSAKAGVTFKWNKVTGATGYTIYRKTGNGGWVKLATVTGNSTVSYLDKTAKKGVTYTYTVRAYYGTSTSCYNTKGLTIKDKY